MRGFREFSLYEGPGAYHRFNKQLEKICSDKGLEMVSLGHVGKNYEIYQVTVDNKHPQTLCYMAGHHGNEQAGPYAVLKFLHEFNPKNAKTYNLKIIPLANPAGFDEYKRRNHDNNDINRHFRDKSLDKHNKMLIDALGGYISFFCSIHEDNGVEGFYVYSSNIVDTKITDKIIKIGSSYFDICKQHKGFGDSHYKKIDGVVKMSKLTGDGSVEDLMFARKVPYIVTETPAGEPLQDRVDCIVEIMHSVNEGLKSN